MFRVGICVCLLAVVVGTTCKLSGTECSEVSIKKNGKEECKGVVVGENKIVVTSARCVYRVPTSRFKVKVGDKENAVKSVFVHPYYRPPGPDYNVAVLKLDNPQELANSSLAKDDALTKDDILKADDREVHPVSLKECQKKLGSSLKLSSKMFCASGGTSLMDGSPLFKERSSNPKADVEKNVVGVYFYEAQGHKVFTKTTNSEIRSFIEKYA